MNGEDVSNDMQELVMSHGDKVLIHTAECVTWKMEHKNCAGCDSELGCGKSVSLMLAILTPMAYKPQSYEDFERMNKSIQEKIDKIINATTPEEVHALIY